MKAIELEKHVSEIAKSLNQHLLESGEIRTDIQWLKRAFWTLAAGGVTFNISLALALISRLWN